MIPRPDGAEPALREQLVELIDLWQYVAMNCRELAIEALTVEDRRALIAAAVNRDDCAKGLEAVLASSQRALEQQEQP